MQSSQRSVTDALKEYGRGIAGGLLFSLPLFYTGEVWLTGMLTHPWRLVGAMVGTYILLLGYNRFAGLRADAGLIEVAIDSVEELGIGVLLAALMLFLLGQIGPGTSLNEIVGKIVTAGLLAAIGVSVGTAQLGGADSAGGDEGMTQVEEDGTLGGELVLSVCGAILIAANVAPTAEVRDISLAIHPWQTLLLALFSLLIGALILFFSDFRGTAAATGFHDVLRGATTTYALALLVSAGLLWFFGRFSGEAAVVGLTQTVILGVAAVLGASAGRSLLK